MDRLDTVLRRTGNISAMNRRRLLVKCDLFRNFEVSLQNVIQYHNHKTTGVLYLQHKILDL